jgi:hypothetical protein
MGEVIAFPSGQVDAAQYCVKEDEDELVFVNTARGARNIARILAEEWPGSEFTVVNTDEEIIFTVRDDLETETL